MSRYANFGRSRAAGQGKYHVAPAERRTYDGIVYHSLAEARRAQQLDWMLRGGAIRSWERQQKYHLGTVHNVYIVDFVVGGLDGSSWAEDVKGCRTKDFVRNVKLWRDFGPFPLHILTASGRSWRTEIVHGGTHAQGPPVPAG